MNEDPNQAVVAELQKIGGILADIKQGFVRVHHNFRYVAGTIGDVTVGLGGGNSAIRFPEAGSTRSVRDFIRAGKVLMVRVHNTGPTNPAYVAFNHNASTDEALIVPGGAVHEFDIEQFDYVSICSTSAQDITTVRVSFWGE